MSACGGGGGGGYTPNSPRPITYYTTPVQQVTVDPMSGSNDNAWFVGDTFVEDIDGDGYADDFIVAGRKTQPATAGTWSNTKLSILSFENGTLVDKTSQWFSGTDNEIMGTEPNVHFADFFKIGRKDMFVSHSTDMRYFGPATFFTNNGSNFTKVSIPTADVWSHGSDVGDLNNDGYLDIVMADLKSYNTTIALNNQVNAFTTYVDPLGNNGDNRYGGSAVAIGNFMNNGGNNEIILTDAQCAVISGTCSDSNTTKMYSVDFTGGVLTYTHERDLPAFSTSGIDHSVEIANHDFNEDGYADVIVFSKKVNNGDNKLSEIQFMQNNGNGIFTDTTSTTLVGYQSNTSSTYKPRFFDINGDGKTDILVSGGDSNTMNNPHNSHQFLLKTSDNKYVAAYQNILTGFITDVRALAVSNGMQDINGSTINIFQADDGNKYLVTWANSAGGGASNDTKLTFFMSRLDGTAIAAGTAIDMIQNAWPYLSNAQAAQALADTGQSFAGGTIINMNKAFQPIGKLTMSGLELNGNVWGFNIGDTTGTAMDGIRRGYNVNLAQTNIQTNGATMYNAVDAFNTVKDGKTTFGADDETQQFTFGHALYQDNTTTYSVHMTKLNSNPWIGFSGVWGEVTGANIMDNVVTYKVGNFTAKGSVMHVSTNFNSGLITEVSDQIGAWGEVSYAKGGFKIDAGVHPVLLDGSVKATIPTSVNMKGNLNYTNHEYALPSVVNGYLKTNYNINLDKNNSKLQFNSAVSQTGLLNTHINYYYKW
ncbi:VCBS repeat-containing protein [Alphaproteobacteria bacterium]|nr:VCBS repeat-containing protein [Alphaproteobacteria bacterium]